MLKIGLDIHGVADEIPAFFGELTSLLVSTDNEVHIITGPSITPEFVEELKGMGLMWTHIFSIVDHHRSIGTPITYDAANHAWMEPYIWDKTKADYCLKHGIQLHFDDSEAYGYFFKTPYARFFSKNKRKHYVRRD